MAFHPLTVNAASILMGARELDHFTRPFLLAPTNLAARRAQTPGARSPGWIGSPPGG
ncbi:MAG TPA: hypothetical protein VGN15_13430 [Ktedonobacteraceae bacterium]|nr:hypothetical protein [Ktedonobacteraceae bacterium]